MAIKLIDCNPNEQARIADAVSNLQGQHLIVTVIEFQTGDV